MAGPFNDVRYEIVVGSPLDDAWAAWFEDFELASDGVTTRMTGRLPDQAALHGVLARLRDLGLPIVAVHRLPGAG